MIPKRVGTAWVNPLEVNGNVAGVGVPNVNSLYVYVNGLPNGWAPDVYDSKVGAWSYGYNYTISSSGTYYLVVATELVQLASPPVSQLPYEAIVVEMTNGALVTSLPTLYLADTHRRSK